MARRKKPTTGTKARKLVDIPLRSYIPDDLEIHHADSMNIVHINGVFYLSFLQYQVPLISDDAEFGRLKEIPNKCVARVTINETTLERTIDVLDKHLKKVRSRKAGEESTDGDTEEDAETHVRADTDASE